jgi:hypothetical protein
MFQVETFIKPGLAIVLVMASAIKNLQTLMEYGHRRVAVIIAAYKKLFLCLYIAAHNVVCLLQCVGVRCCCYCSRAVLAHVVVLGVAGVVTRICAPGYGAANVFMCVRCVSVC